MQIAVTAFLPSLPRALPSTKPVSRTDLVHVQRRNFATRKRAPYATVPLAFGASAPLSGGTFALAACAAFLASASAVAITHPIDTLKTIRQARDLDGRKPDASRSVCALYRGVWSNILKEAPNAAIYLACYEVLRIFLLSLPFFRALPLLAMCVAGMLGDAIGSVVRVPAEVLNKRLQLGLSCTLGSAVRDVFFVESGMQTTLASWIAVLWRDVPYGGLQIAGYEFSKMMLMNLGYSGMIFNVLAGATAGLVAAMLTTPADVLVTRMSAQNPQCYLETRRYMSPAATFRRIVKKEGMQSLWTGTLARGLYYAPMIGIFFALYEMFKKIFACPGEVAKRATGLFERISVMIGGFVGNALRKSAGAIASMGMAKVALLLVMTLWIIRRRRRQQPSM